MSLWRRFFTSRYTLLLEQQVEELKQEKIELKVEITRLNQALVPQLRHMAREQAQTAPKITLEPRRPQPSANKEIKPSGGNWLQLRQHLEIASDIKNVNFEEQAKLEREA